MLSRASVPSLVSQATSCVHKAACGTLLLSSVDQNATPAGDGGCARQIYVDCCPKKAALLWSPSLLGLGLCCPKLSSDTGFLSSQEPRQEQSVCDSVRFPIRSIDLVKESKY